MGPLVEVDVKVGCAGVDRVRGLEVGLVLRELLARTADSRSPRRIRDCQAGGRNDRRTHRETRAPSGRSAPARRFPARARRTAFLSPCRPHFPPRPRSPASSHRRSVCFRSAERARRPPPSCTSRSRLHQGPFLLFCLDVRAGIAHRLLDEREVPDRSAQVIDELALPQADLERLAGGKSKLARLIQNGPRS